MCSYSLQFFFRFPLVFVYTFSYVSTMTTTNNTNGTEKSEVKTMKITKRNATIKALADAIYDNAHCNAHNPCILWSKDCDFHFGPDPALTQENAVIVIDGPDPLDWDGSNTRAGAMHWARLMIDECRETVQNIFDEEAELNAE